MDESGAPPQDSRSTDSARGCKSRDQTERTQFRQLNFWGSRRLEAPSDEKRGLSFILPIAESALRYAPGPGMSSGGPGDSKPASPRAYLPAHVPRPLEPLPACSDLQCVASQLTLPYALIRPRNSRVIVADKQTTTGGRLDRAYGNSVLPRKRLVDFPDRIPFRSGESITHPHS